MTGTRALDHSGENRHLEITFGCGFLVSLILEALQVWMPSRSSSMLDVVLNGSGVDAFLRKFAL